uniref:Secreted protein n=1 Tax=Dracunculus medinensis TaxID=318479 RepID=A0A0N4U9Q8_DRAME
LLQDFYFLIWQISIPLFQSCDYITLVKCFINILDEWAWTLYELKDNVVTINEGQCEHLRQLDQCINLKDLKIRGAKLSVVFEDSGPNKHECDHNEIIAASNTVSDLLTHRKNSGSFLKSYYLLTYACSQEGQNLLKEHRECLAEERIGEMTLSAGTYLSEKFLEHPDDQVCDEVNGKLQEYISAMKGICHSESAQMIMCKSLTNMFKGLHADKLHNCHFECNIAQRDDDMEDEEDDESEEGEIHEQTKNVVPESGSLNKASILRHFDYSSLTSFMTLIFALLLLF